MIQPFHMALPGVRLLCCFWPFLLFVHFHIVIVIVTAAVAFFFARKESIAVLRTTIYVNESKLLARQHQSFRISLEVFFYLNRKTEFGRHTEIV